MPVVGKAGSVATVLELRRRTGISQRELAEMCGVSRESITHLENGYRPMVLLHRLIEVIDRVYLRRDPVHGALKARLGLDPDGEIPPDVLAKFEEERSEKVKVVGYTRRKRKDAKAAAVEPAEDWSI